MKFLLNYLLHTIILVGLQKYLLGAASLKCLPRVWHSTLIDDYTKVCMHHLFYVTHTKVLHVAHWLKNKLRECFPYYGKWFNSFSSDLLLLLWMKPFSFPNRIQSVLQLLFHVHSHNHIFSSHLNLLSANFWTVFWRRSKKSKRNLYFLTIFLSMQLANKQAEKNEEE